MENIPTVPQGKEKEPTVRYYYKITAITSYGPVTDYLSGESQRDVKEIMKKKYPLSDEESKSIGIEPISKEEFVKRIKQVYAIRNKREEKDW